MIIHKEAKVYEGKTVKGQPFTVTFFHKEAGELVDGVTSETILDILIHRHKCFMAQVDSVENINIYTHLCQAKTWLSQRNHVKQRRNLVKKSTE